MDPFQLLVEDQFAPIRAIINKTVLHDYGIISRDMGDGYVEVLSAQKRCGSIQRIACKYLSLSSSKLSLGLPPTVGDLVMVVALQHRQDEIFKSSEPTEVYAPSGYTYGSCVAIPFGVFKDDADTRISVTDDLVDITTSKPVTLTSEDDVTINSNKFAVDAEGDASIDGAKVTLNGDSKSLVTYTELNAALTSFVTQLSITLASGSNGAGPVVFASPPPSSIDISAAQTQTVKTGG